MEGGQICTRVVANVYCGIGTENEGVGGVGIFLARYVVCLYALVFDNIMLGVIA